MTNPDSEDNHDKFKVFGIRSRTENLPPADFLDWRGGRYHGNARVKLVKPILRRPPVRPSGSPKFIAILIT